MEPPSFKSGSAFCTVKNTPRVLILNVLSKWFGVADARNPNSTNPALAKPIIPKSAQIPLCVTWRKSDQSPVLMAFLKILRELKPVIRKQMEEHPWEEIRPIRRRNKSQPVKPLN
jgi:hypothetical protein